MVWLKNQADSYMTDDKGNYVRFEIRAVIPGKETQYEIKSWRVTRYNGGRYPENCLELAQW